jgi:hypothetical protein
VVPEIETDLESSDLYCAPMDPLSIGIFMADVDRDKMAECLIINQVTGSYCSPPPPLVSLETVLCQFFELH